MRFKEYLKLAEQAGESKRTAPFTIPKKDLKDPAIPLEKSEKELLAHVMKLMKKIGLFQKIKSARLTGADVIMVTIPVRTEFILDTRMAALLGKDPFFKTVVIGKKEAVFAFTT